MHTSKAKARGKAYIEKICDVGQFAVWKVDGSYVRRELDENFVGYDSNSHLPFIPRFEFWIDAESDPREWFFFIGRLFNLEAARAEGKPSKEANDEACAIEKEQRRLLELIEHHASHSAGHKELVEKIHKKKYERYPGPVTVWFVDGMLVRDTMSVDYVDGGHDRVYSFIPKDEIWLEEVMSEDEARFVLVHELHERFLMGKGKDYRRAHAGATEVEDYLRDHKEELEERLKEEMAKNATEVDMHDWPLFIDK